MKKLNITYDTAEIENGEKIVGETCYTVKMQDVLAEQLLQSVEILQGRKFVDGSIKHYELVKEG